MISREKFAKILKSNETFQFQALYYTGNRSVSLATNWIFDHPELDLETPLEEELRKLEAEEDEDDELDDEDDEDEIDSDEEAYLRHHHHHLQHR